MNASGTGRIVRRSRGFTLIELLVVVAIIALLISILLPSLKNAREQAKRVKCQANQRSITQALVVYVLVEDQDYPLGKAGCTGCCWATWTWGGWLGKNPYWNTYAGGIFKVAAKDRPLTRYMNKNVTDPLAWTGAPFAQGSVPLEELVGQPIFQCPSDKTSYQSQWQPNPGSTYSSYDDVGSSYHLNYYWWAQVGLPLGDHDGDGIVEPILKQPNGTPQCVTTGCPAAPVLWTPCFNLGKQIWKKYSKGKAGKFEVLSEDPFDYAVSTGTSTLGVHGQFSKHNIAFLDGHVEYVKVNTKENENPDRSEWNWTVIDEDYESSFPL